MVWAGSSRASGSVIFGWFKVAVKLPAPTQDSKWKTWGFKAEDVSCGSLWSYIKVGMLVFPVVQEKFVSCSGFRKTIQGLSNFVCERVQFAKQSLGFFFFFKNKFCSLFRFWNAAKSFRLLFYVAEKNIVLTGLFCFYLISPFISLPNKFAVWLGNWEQVS